MKNKNIGGIGGFVLIELLISMSLATLLMGVVLFGYRVFTNNLAIRAAAQEVVVAMRQAQTQAIPTRQVSATSDFSTGYGVSFNLSDPTSYYIFADKNGNGKYDGDVNCSAGTECLAKNSFKNNVSLYSFCGTDPSNTKTCPPLAAQNLNVIFSSTNQEKASDAKIQFTDSSGNVLPTSYTSAQIFVGIGGQAPFSEVSVNTAGTVYISSGQPLPTTNHPPVIALNGSNPMTVQTGSTFTDPGATATDQEDGDLTSSIAVSGHVNTLISGTYTLTYNVTDSGGLSATPVTRNVMVASACVPSFVASGQTQRSWYATSVNSSNGDVYATVYNGDIYKQTAGTGAFNALNATGATRYWVGISVNSSNGDVYASVTSGDIYKQTAGTGTWNALNATGATKYWRGVSVNPSNGDVYAVVSGGDIYKQTAGTGTFNALNATGATKYWVGISVNSSNGDVYVATATGIGDIYKQTAGTGTWNALNATGATKNWSGISVNSSNGDVYATVAFSDIYKQTAGTGTWNALNATGATKSWIISISVNSSNGDVYAVDGSDIYKYTPCPTGNTPPVITLNGSNPMTVQTGSTFTDPGAMATDSQDGNLTSSIVTTGSVNTSVAGTYTLTYNVTDSGGLSATSVTRNVMVASACGPSFVALGQNGQGISVNSSNGDVYATVYNGDIYKQTAGTGTWNALNATGAKKNWNGVSVNPSNGDVYATVSNGDIYKQTAGTGTWNALNATGAAKAWWSISVNPSNGDVYAVDGNYIYKQTAGTGTWNVLNATGAAEAWIGISVNSSNGDVYATLFGGDIYKQTAGTGTWNALNATGATKGWLGISVNSSNGDVYAAVVLTGDIYKQTAGTGTWNALNATGEAKNWYGISVNSSNGDVYAVGGNNIYKYTPCP